MTPSPEWVRAPDTYPIAKRIVQLRRLLLVHCHLYYRLDTNLITDHKWQAMADELAVLQLQHPSQLGFYDAAFQNWDGSTGYHLPSDLEIANVAHRLLRATTVNGLVLTTTVNSLTIDTPSTHRSPSMTALVLNPLPTPESAAPAAPPGTPVDQGASPIATMVQGLIDQGADFAALTKTYMAVRDKKKDLETAAKLKIAPLSEALSLIENHLLAKFGELGVDNVKTPFGTPYISTTTTITVADADIFQRFVLETAFNGLSLQPHVRDAIITHMLDSGALALMETRAAKSAVETYASSNDKFPPGLNSRTERKLNVKAK